MEMTSRQAGAYHPHLVEDYGSVHDAHSHRQLGLSHKFATPCPAHKDPSHLCKSLTDSTQVLLHAGAHILSGKETEIASDLEKEGSQSRTRRTCQRKLSVRENAANRE